MSSNVLRLVALATAMTLTTGCGVGQVAAPGEAVDDGLLRGASGGGGGASVGARTRPRCSVTVSGIGTVPFESDYLPHVLYCEMTAVGADLPARQRIHALAAGAIAARTFAYQKLRTRSVLRNSVADQVYRASHCRGAVPELFAAAVRATHDVVMRKSDGTPHEGYFRAGSSVCAPRAYCFGEPCMGQNNAGQCAREGLSVIDILDMAYEDPRYVRLTGACGDR